MGPDSTVTRPNARPVGSSLKDTCKGTEADDLLFALKLVTRVAMRKL